MPTKSMRPQINGKDKIKAVKKYGRDKWKYRKETNT